MKKFSEIRLIVVGELADYPGDFGYQNLVALEFKFDKLSKAFAMLSTFETIHENSKDVLEFQIFQSQVDAVNSYGEKRKIKYPSFMVSDDASKFAYVLKVGEFIAAKSKLTRDVAEFLSYQGLIIEVSNLLAYEGLTCEDLIIDD